MSQAPEKYLSSGDGPGNPDFPSKTQSGGLQQGKQHAACTSSQASEPRSFSCSQSNGLSKGGNGLVLNPHGLFSFSDGSQIALATDILPRGLRIRKP